MIHVNNFSNGALNPVLAYVMSCVGCFLGRDEPGSLFRPHRPKIQP